MADQTSPWRRASALCDQACSPTRASSGDPPASDARLHSQGYVDARLKVSDALDWCECESRKTLARRAERLTKPFGSAELSARVRAILRRAPTAAELAAITFGDITVDFTTRTVRKDGTEVKLTPKEYALLRMLVLHRGKVVTHRQILRELWGPKSEEQTHYLRVHMAHLRQKLEAEPHHPRHFRTESGIGYRLVEG